MLYLVWLQWFQGLFYKSFVRCNFERLYGGEHRQQCFVNGFATFLCEWLFFFFWFRRFPRCFEQGTSASWQFLRDKTSWMTAKLWRELARKNRINWPCQREARQARHFNRYSIQITIFGSWKGELSECDIALICTKTHSQTEPRRRPFGSYVERCPDHWFLDHFIHF